MGSFLISAIPCDLNPLYHVDPVKERFGENPDVVGCDLDGSKLYIPDHLRIPQLPEMVEKELIHRLTLASQPGLATADLAFLPSKQAPSPPEILDKEVRSIFLLFLVRTLQKRVSRLKISKYSRVFFVNIKKIKKLLF